MTRFSKRPAAGPAADVTANDVTANDVTTNDVNEPCRVYNPGTNSTMALGRCGIHVDGARLRNLRQRVGWTQEFAAKKSGYSARLIRKLESGGPVQWRTLLDVLGCYQADDQVETVEAPTQFVVEGSSRWLPATSDRFCIGRWLESVYQNPCEFIMDRDLIPRSQLIADGQTYHGRQAIRDRYVRFRNAFDPIEFGVDQIVSQRDNQSVFWTMRHRHVASFNGHPPSKRWLTVRGCTFLTLSGRKIAMLREHSDIMHQLVLTQPPNR